MNVKRIAQLGILMAMALVLGWVEQVIPIAPGIPGVKLGLSNTVLLYALYMLNGGSAALLMVAKVLLSGFMFTGLSAMLYSLAGGVLSLGLMLLIKRIVRVDIIVVSMAGAVAHNIGQLAIACFMIPARAILGYLPVLLVSGLIMGCLTGIVAKYALKGLRGSGPKRSSAPASEEREG